MLLGCKSETKLREKIDFVPTVEYNLFVEYVAKLQESGNRSSGPV